MTPVNASALDVGVATDPRRSVVVEACAGSGKTWLLSARILRCLLEGTPPQAILALTFTRKAAAEMAQRVSARLRELADLGEAEAESSLRAMGLTEEEAHRLAGQASEVYERFLAAEHAPTITTFDAWNQRLLRSSPLPLAGLKSLALAPRPWQQRRRQIDEVLRRSLGRRGSALAQLIALEGETAAMGLLHAMAARRSQRSLRAGTLWPPIDNMAPEASTADGYIVWRQAHRAGFFEQHRADIVRLAQGLPAAMPQSKASSTAQPLYAACQAWRDHPGEIDALWAVWIQCFCTKSVPELFDLDQPPHRALRKKLGDKAFHAALQASGLSEVLGRLGEALLAAEAHQWEARHGLRTRLAADLAQLWERVQLDDEAATNETDHAGIEAAALSLVQGEGSAHPLSRLDLRYQQILLDEFQDTSPAQWTTIRTWLEAYTGQSIPQANHPAVFLVGDPKQSIYGFRGAQLAMFRSASDWLVAHYNAVLQATVTTRRCGPAVVDDLNRLCPRIPGGEVLRPHASQPKAQSTVPPELHGTWRLPAPEASAGDLPEAWGAPHASGADDSADDDEDSAPPAALAEGRRIAAAIVQLVGDGAGAIAYRDIRILLPVKTQLPAYEAGLAEAGIPFITSRASGLLASPEVMDFLSLARALAVEGLEPIEHRLAAAGCWLPGENAAQQLSEWANLLRPILPVLPAAEALSDILRCSGPERWALGYAPQPPAQTLANLQALLVFALQSEAGRLPGLLPCLQDMEERLLAGGEATGGPGVLPETLDAVQIQSVHAAKGLESPVVILAGMDSRRRAESGLQLFEDWADGHAHLAGLRLGSRAEPPALGGLLERWRALRQHRVQEDFHLAYVAMTRAQSMVLLSGLAPPKASALQHLGDAQAGPSGLAALWALAQSEVRPWPASAEVAVR